MKQPGSNRIKYHHGGRKGFWQQIKDIATMIGLWFLKKFVKEYCTVVIFIIIFFYADDSKLIGNVRLPKTLNYTNKVMGLATNQNAASSISIDKDKPGTGN